METEGQKIQRLAFEAFGRWVREFIDNNPNAELSMLELAELYGKYGEEVIKEAKKE